MINLLLNKSMKVQRLYTKGSNPEKKSASIWTLSKGGGGLTRIQIVRGTI